MPVHETTDRSLEEKTTLLLLGLLIAGCSTTNTLGGITCPHYDDACALARQNTFRANNGLPPQTMEQWWAMGQDDSGYSTSSATSGPTSYIVRPHPNQVWLQDEKLNNCQATSGTDPLAT